MTAILLGSASFLPCWTGGGREREGAPRVTSPVTLVPVPPPSVGMDPVTPAPVSRLHSGQFSWVANKRELRNSEN